MKPVIIDYEVYDKHFGRIGMMASTQVETKEIASFVFNEFQHRVTPISTSIVEEEHKNFYMYSCLIRNESEVKWSKLDNAVKLTANSYLDQNLGIIWEKKKVEGKDVFIRKNDASLESLLIEASSKVSKGYMTQIFAFAKVTPRYNVGSNIECFVKKNDKWECYTGILNSILNDYEVTVKVDGNIYKIPYGCVTKVFTSQEDRNRASDILNQCYKKPDITTSFRFGGK